VTTDLELAVEVKGIAGLVPAWQVLSSECRREPVRGIARVGADRWRP
jgi:hypothetical protein